MRRTVGTKANGGRTRATREENQVYSGRVVRSEFDRNWSTRISGGYVIYTALKQKAEVEVLLSTGASKRLIFPRGGKVLVGGGGTSHYTKPHTAIDL